METDKTFECMVRRIVAAINILDEGEAMDVMHQALVCEEGNSEEMFFFAWHGAQATVN